MRDTSPLVSLDISNKFHSLVLEQEERIGYKIKDIIIVDIESKDHLKRIKIECGWQHQQLKQINMLISSILNE